MAATVVPIKKFEKKVDKLTDAIDGMTNKYESTLEKWEERDKAHEKDMEKYIERLESLEAAILRHEIKKIGGASMHSPIPKDKWSWSRYCYGIATKDWSAAKHEKAEIDKWNDKRKTMQAGSFDAGGSLVPPQYIAELIEFLRPELITSRLGVRTLTGLTGSPIMIPKLTAGVSHFWIAPEGTTITPSDQTTGRLEMQPKKVATLVKLSRELTTLSNPAVEAGVRMDIIRALQEGIDQAFFRGTGSNGQPVGLQNWTPAILDAGGTWESNPTTANDHLANLNILKDLRKQLGLNNALRGRIAWAVNVESWEAIDRMVDGNNRPFLQVDPANGFRGTLLGFPIEQSTLVAPTSGTGPNRIYLGNWEDALLLIWQNMAVEESTQADTAFANDELWIKATALVNSGIRRNVSFCKQDAVDES